MKRTLVVEDEPRLRELIESALRGEGHLVEGVSDGGEAFERALTGAYDLLVLDLMLPTMSGLEISVRLRRRGVETSILMLTARNSVADRVDGLDAGADDYLVKPFAVDELLARSRAVLRRRTDSGQTSVLRVADLVLDPLRHTAGRGDRRVELTARESGLLEYLMLNAGRVVTRSQIIDRVWPHDFEGGDEVVETYVHYLREKVDRPPPHQLIRTRRGLGYILAT